MPTVLITGATGQQGSGAIAHLLDRGITVHALTRDASSAAAQSLKERGVKVFQGSYDDIPSIEAAAAGVDSVFLNVVPESPTGEVQDAKNIIAAAKSAGASQLVYTSVLGADWADELVGAERAKVLPEGGYQSWYWAHKSEIEQMTKSSGFRHWTILRPGMFMSILLAGPKGAFLPRPVEGKEHCEFKTGLGPDKQVSVIHPDDIGKAIALVLAEPERFDRKIVDVAAENVTPRGIAAAMERVSGKTVIVTGYTQQEIDKAGVSDPLIETQVVWNRLDNRADLGHLRDEGLGLRSLDQFLAERKEVLMETLAGKVVAWR